VFFFLIGNIFGSDKILNKYELIFYLLLKNLL